MRDSLVRLAQWRGLVNEMCKRCYLGFLKTQVERARDEFLFDVDQIGFFRNPLSGGITQ
jgi:hypothetical protein